MSKKKSVRQEKSCDIHQIEQQINDKVQQTILKALEPWVKCIARLRRELALRDWVLESPELLEKLAAVEHERWMRNAKTLLEQETISQEHRDRWLRECLMPYTHLSEEMKEYDRIEARRSLAVIFETLEQKIEELMGEREGKA